MGRMLDFLKAHGVYGWTEEERTMDTLGTTGGKGHRGARLCVDTPLPYYDSMTK